MTTLPGVRLFCLYTFWGITFTYLYQITYFTALMAYAGEMEDKGRHALFVVPAMAPGETSKSRVVQRTTRLVDLQPAS